MEDVAVMQDDNELFLRVQSHNDVEAFKMLYRRYHKRIFAYCLYIIKDEEGARDAFQSTFTAVYEQRMQFVPGMFSKWMFTIAKRQSMRVYKHIVSNRLPHDFDELATEEILDEDSLSQPDVVVTQLIADAMQALSPEFRTVLQLRYYEDLPYEDIAQRLNITLSLAKVRVNRAKAQLQQALQLKQEDIS